jgi:hypothetical protein
MKGIHRGTCLSVIEAVVRKRNHEIHEGHEWGVVSQPKGNDLK